MNGHFSCVTCRLADTRCTWLQHAVACHFTTLGGAGRLLHLLCIQLTLLLLPINVGHHCVALHSLHAGWLARVAPSCARSATTSSASVSTPTCCQSLSPSDLNLWLVHTLLLVLVQQQQQQPRQQRGSTLRRCWPVPASCRCWTRCCSS